MLNGWAPVLAYSDCQMLQDKAKAKGWIPNLARDKHLSTAKSPKHSNKTPGTSHWWWCEQSSLSQCTISYMLESLLFITSIGGFAVCCYEHNSVQQSTWLHKHPDQRLSPFSGMIQSDGPYNMASHLHQIGPCLMSLLLLSGILQGDAS